jgi:ligand-binding sensor domain-containing protein/serine phosphatase RsbU (regulator of sigma subunit)
MTSSTAHRIRNLIPATAFLLAALILPAPGLSQQGIVFQHLTVEQGLSQGSVVCTFQDHLGFIWFGTQEGLNRYDGYRFTVFKHTPGDSTSLNGSFVITIAEDSSGTLYVGTLGKTDEWNRFDRRTETFSIVPGGNLDIAKARLSSVYQSYEDPAGVRWSGTTGGGLTRLDRRTGKSTNFRHDPANPGSLLDNRVYSVFGDRTGTIWVGTREGLERFDPRTETFVHYRHDEKNPASLSDNWVWPIIEDRSGALWVGTFRAGLNRFDRATESFTRFKHNEANPRTLVDDRLYSLYLDRAGLVWAGTSNGVDCFNPESGAFLHYNNDPKNPNGLVHNAVYSMYVDRQGSAWIGTEGGLDRWDRKNDRFIHFKHDAANPRSLGENLVQCMTEDNTGALWLGTQSSGLDKFDRASGTFTHFRHDSADAGSISDNRIYALLEDRAGVLWVGTYGGGLNRFDRKTNAFRAYRHVDSIEGSLGAAGVWALLEDRNGTLWVGTYKGGLDRFNPETETFTHFKSDQSNPGSLSNEYVLCLYEDRKGNLWVGTMSGLNRFDPASGTFVRFFEKDGLPNAYINGILEDAAGNLWISTVKGLSRFDPVTQTFRNFDQSDGLQGNEFNTGAFAQDHRTGEMYFGGMNGFNVFNPERVKNSPYVPPVVFAAFTRYNTADAGGRPIMEKGIAVRPKITLSYKDNVATFEFAALSFSNSFKNQYAYKLEGYNDDWIQLGTQRAATFTNLDGGDYVLRVKGSNEDGVWNEEGTSLAITVTPPWWKTRWAYASYVLIVLGILYGLRTVELNRREQKAAIREAELHAKAVEAENRALEIENDRKTKELEDARLLQLSMLPRAVPEIAGYEISVFMKTATEVGGDYYDFVQDAEKGLNIAFGDATGHGMQAGTIVTLMKGLFLSNASRFDLQEFFAHCNASIREIRLTRLYMALTLVRLRENSLSFTCAGMPPVFIYRKETGAVEEVLLSGMPLGAMKKYPYGFHQTDLAPGDAVLLLTDGLPEQKNVAGEMFDYARVQALLAEKAGGHPDELIATLTSAGDAFMDGALQDDDFTMLVIKRKS